MVNTQNFNKTKTANPILERTVKVSRVAKVIKGGRTLRFTATVVVGNGNGELGIGNGKAANVPDAVKKAVSQAKKNMILIPVINGTLPYEIKSKFCGSVVLLKPAPEGTGIKAGATLRAISEVLGIKNITTKVWRSTNPSNVVKAAFKGLNSMVDIKNELELRTNTIKNNMSVNIHTGTNECIAKIRLIESSDLSSGDTGYVQLKFDRPLVVSRGDHFVIRTNMFTLGGGVILEP